MSCSCGPQLSSGAALGWVTSPLASRSGFGLVTAWLGDVNGNQGTEQGSGGESLLSQFLHQGSPRGPAGEFMFEFDQDEIFHMNLERKTIWRLPNFGKFTSFEAQRALGNITVLKKNMEIMIRRSNRSAPEMTVFPEDHVELGEPNILICFMDNFSPPVLSLTWLKNGSPTCSSSRQSNFYDYQVEHGGLPEPFTKHWGKAGAPEDPAGHMSGSQDSWVLSQLWEGSGAGSQDAWVLSQLWDRSWV
uniref:Ig-like domain-containing protein n=1 Tax=Gopherus agassizii TaxID=38772 RepID=A0A452IQE9_9SAUR